VGREEQQKQQKQQNKASGLNIIPQILFTYLLPH
jgi:hypothetical protein